MGDRVVKSKQVRLYAHRGERSSRTVDLYLNEDGAIKVEGGDVGPAVEQAFGDSDYEFWATVAPDEVKNLCFALLMERLKEDASAVDTLRDFCKEHNIECKFGNWI